MPRRVCVSAPRNAHTSWVFHLLGCLCPGFVPGSQATCRLGGPGAVCHCSGGGGRAVETVANASHSQMASAERAPPACDGSLKNATEKSATLSAHSEGFLWLIPHFRPIASWQQGCVVCVLLDLRSIPQFCKIHHTHVVNGRNLVSRCSHPLAPPLALVACSHIGNETSACCTTFPGPQRFVPETQKQKTSHIKWVKQATSGRICRPR